jgi:hypothetical protein
LLQVKSIERYQHHSILQSGSSKTHAFSVSLGRVRRSFMISLSLSPTTAINVSSMYPLPPLSHTTNGINIPALAFIQSTVTGALNKLSFALNLLRASVVLVASAMTLPAWAGPRYSRMLVNWSAVGVDSCTSAWRTHISLRLQHIPNPQATSFHHIPNVNSVLSSLLCLEWSPAWSSVAVEAAFAAVCFKRVWTRTEAGVEGWWKRVMTSFLADY